ncbi:PAAR domain-containing protein [Paraburkholderia dinghuensis]|uniref:PAAR domain-containing protein n=1 Tax=Paraburkholderia dinghuensis TaxID=2305225 RepID=A0A3N6NL33_9BURK|nr:PAAR domain-containing protein [Paraburkholderia dinghuensis]RQH09892.1 hypothetical protein D1Y85_01755 [Paraburkholderia dinghuensis]
MCELPKQYSFFKAGTDRTSSNGEVSTGSKICFFMGKGVARVGDPVSCPKHGDNPPYA